MENPAEAVIQQSQARLNVLETVCFALYRKFETAELRDEISATLISNSEVAARLPTLAGLAALLRAEGESWAKRPVPSNGAKK